MRAVLPASASVERDVAAPPEVLWPLVSDPQVPARFSPELEDAHVDGGGAATLGAVIVGRNARAGRAWTTRSTVVECEPPRRFGWATGDEDHPTATWTIDIRATQTGAVLRHRVVLHEGLEPLAGAVAREPARAASIVEGRLAELVAGMAATLEGIASLAEAAGSS